MTSHEAEVRWSLKDYALGFAVLGLAVLVRWLLDPILGNTFPLVTIFAAVAATVWLGGYVLALMVTILGYGICHYLFIDPRGHLDLSSTTNVVGMVAYLITCMLIILFGEMARMAQTRATERREVFRVTLRSIG